MTGGNEDGVEGRRLATIIKLIAVLSLIGVFGWVMFRGIRETERSEKAAELDRTRHAFEDGYWKGVNAALRHIEVKDGHATIELTNVIAEMPK